MNHSTLHFQNKLMTQHWHGTGARTRPLIAAMLQRLRSERPEEDVYGDPLPKMRLEGDLAIIPITGVLMVNVPAWIKERGFNITDANDIAEEVSQAINDPRVTMIVLDVDSPGGWALAGDKLFAIIEAGKARKPIFGWCADGADCCSSAYEAVAPCFAILCGPFAGAVGCIGSYLAILDDTEFWKMMGVTWEVFRSGELKGIGEDGISEAQRIWLQSTTDACGATFRANVQKYRAEIPVTEMEGQYYNGLQAARLGFTVGTARDLPAAITRFRRMLG